MSQSLDPRLRPEFSHGLLEHVRAAASAVAGADEVVADEQREQEHRAAGLDLIRVGAESPEQRAVIPITTLLQ